jgi:hypothetical protein
VFGSLGIPMRWAHIPPPQNQIQLRPIWEIVKPTQSVRLLQMKYHRLNHTKCADHYLDHIVTGRLCGVDCSRWFEILLHVRPPCRQPHGSSTCRSFALFRIVIFCLASQPHEQFLIKRRDLQLSNRPLHLCHPTISPVPVLARYHCWQFAYEEKMYGMLNNQFTHGDIFFGTDCVVDK